MAQPQRIGEHLGGLKTQVISCPGAGEGPERQVCGTELEQTRFLGRWTPELCSACLRLQDGARDQGRALTLARSAELDDIRRAKVALEALAVPKLYADVSFETFQFHGEPKDREKQARAVQLGRRFIGLWPEVDDDHQLIVLQGLPGTGKGHWAWAVARAVAEGFGASVRVNRLADLVREIRGSWRGKEGPSEEQVLNKYRRLDLLVIDEVSRHAFYGQSTQHLFDVINDRIEQQRPTVLTTNEDEKGIEEILGPALWDRIHGSGGLIEFGNTSWRRRNRKEFP